MRGCSRPRPSGIAQRWSEGCGRPPHPGSLGAGPRPPWPGHARPRAQGAGQHRGGRWGRRRGRCTARRSHRSNADRHAHADRRSSPECLGEFRHNVRSFCRRACGDPRVVTSQSPYEARAQATIVMPTPDPIPQRRISTGGAPISPRRSTSRSMSPLPPPQPRAPRRHPAAARSAAHRGAGRPAGVGGTQADRRASRAGAAVNRWRAQSCAASATFRPTERPPRAQFETSRPVSGLITRASTAPPPAAGPRQRGTPAGQVEPGLGPNRLRVADEYRVVSHRWTCSAPRTGSGRGAAAGVSSVKRQPSGAFRSTAYQSGRPSVCGQGMAPYSHSSRTSSALSARESRCR